MDIESDVSTSTGDNADADDTFRASLKLVLSSIPYKDCGAGAEGKVEIAFDREGTVTSVAIVSGDYDQATTSCLVARFRGVRAPPASAERRVVLWGIRLERAAAKGSWDP